MPLDPQIKAMLDDQKALNLPPTSTLPATVVRQGFLDWATQEQQLLGAPMPVAAVVDRTIPGPASEVPLRIYTPAGAAPFPVLLFMHGGGFVIGNLDTHDEICRLLCVGAGCVIVSVDYRLAPDDCLAAVRWVGTHTVELGGNRAKIAVGGDSAGGNLTAVTALRSRDQGGLALCGQLLIYPWMNLHEFKGRSMVENGQEYGLPLDDLRWYAGQYLNNVSDTDNPYALPLLAPNLGDLPPALVITAEYDPLRDDSAAYAKRLRDSGVPTEYMML